MKNKKVRLALIVVLLAFASTCLTACGSLANMSSEDAYNVGYGAGTLIRNQGKRIKLLAERADSSYPSQL